jgi:RNA polymerase sigma-70 factor (ECF subfamily)
MGRQTREHTAEERFAAVFGHLGAVAAYARRRGAADAEAIAAEVMAIAWRRLADVPQDDARPWLYATARNLIRAEYRRRRATTGDAELERVAAEAVPTLELDPPLATALADLSPFDREALLLIAWDDLTPGQAARSLGIKPTAFRVRLLRARRRIRRALEEATDEQRLLQAQPELEST